MGGGGRFPTRRDPAIYLLNRYLPFVSDFVAEDKWDYTWTPPGPGGCMPIEAIVKGSGDERERSF